MPREYLIVSPEPITAIECVTATNTVDPDLGLGRLWQGGGLQVASDDSLVLAVLRSATIEHPAETERLIGRALPAGASYLTEAYGPFAGADDARDTTGILARELAAQAGGTLIAIGESS